MGVDAQMLVRTKADIREEDIIDWSFRICESFGVECFLVDPERGWRALEIIDEHFQDGDTIYPEHDETLIKVNLMTRYYGEGYERGDLPSIVCVAEWLEQNIPKSEVWYGGDSSGICAQPFGHKERHDLFRHFAKVGHQPYRSYGVSVEWCDFCQHHMIQYGFGRNWAAFACPGCGQKREYRDGDLVETA